MNTANHAKSLLAAWLACFTWLLPVPHALAAGRPAAPAPATAGIWDVRLDERGTLRGQLVDLEGRPAAGEKVELQRAGQTVAEAVSREDGQFAFAGTPAGICQLRLGSSAVTCRAWTAEAAPPAARDRLVVLSAPEALRGQQPIHAIFRNPLFIGLVVAAAIAIPIAVHNAKDDQPSGS